VTAASQRIDQNYPEQLAIVIGTSKIEDQDGFLRKTLARTFKL